MHGDRCTCGIMILIWSWPAARSRWRHSNSKFIWPRAFRMSCTFQYKPTDMPRIWPVQFRLIRIICHSCLATRLHFHCSPVYDLLTIAMLLAPVKRSFTRLGNCQLSAFHSAVHSCCQTLCTQSYSTVGTEIYIAV